MDYSAYTKACKEKERELLERAALVEPGFYPPYEPNVAASAAVVEQLSPSERSTLAGEIDDVAFESNIKVLRALA